MKTQPVIKDEVDVPASDGSAEGGNTKKEEEQPLMAASSSTGLKKEDSPTLPSLEEIDANIRSFINEDTITLYTRRKVREAVEKNLGLDAGALLPVKAEVNELVTRLIAEQDVDASPDVSPHHFGSEIFNFQPEERKISKRTHENDVADERPRKTTKTAKSRQQKASQSEAQTSSEAVESAESEDDDSDVGSRRSKRPKAKAKAGAKKQQAGLMSRAQFNDVATAMEAKIGPFNFRMEPRQFGTGSCGWYFGTKVPLPVGDKEPICLLNVNCTIVGSKGWSDGKSKKKSREE